MEHNVWVTACGITSFGSDRYQCCTLEGTVHQGTSKLVDILDF
jgi:hypothetical protein